MVTITEDYVSFETAKLLKEKGFDEPCRCWYYVLGTTPLLVERRYDDYYEQSKYTDKIFPCITLQMAMKWLREVHNCPIEIRWNWNANNQCQEWYFVHHMELKPLPQIQYYDTYEETAEAAIKYCLENLI